MTSLQGDHQCIRTISKDMFKKNARYVIKLENAQQNMIHEDQSMTPIERKDKDKEKCKLQRLQTSQEEESSRPNLR